MENLALLESAARSSVARSGLYTEFRMGKFIRNALACHQTRAIICRRFTANSLYQFTAMPFRSFSLFRICCAVLFLCSGALLFMARAQQGQPTTQEQTDETLRISTELVQTDVTVFDKQGRFVDNLKPEQFQLFVDGRLQKVSFFERVAAGSSNEEALLAAARGQGGSREKALAVNPLDRGRVIFFLVDDLHMSPDSLIRTRKTIARFIDREMGQNDRAAITSATGQVGFLQQLTDNKSVLLRAAERLKTSVQSRGDMEFPPMSETQAVAIQVQNDQEMLRFFMEPLIKNGVPPPNAETAVRNRAKHILSQAYRFARNTLDTLENLARTSGQVAGRKLFFFISDGFIFNLTEPDMLNRLRNITNAAARSGVVIYTLDARGLTTGSLDDSTSPPPFDPQGRTVRASVNDISSMQEPLQTLAANTGGRALLTSNSLNEGLTRALLETSRYYLLAWRPPGEEQRGNKFRRIEVKVVGRPDLSVYVRRGFYDLETKPAPKKGKAVAEAVATKTIEAELRATLQAAYPKQALPTHLALAYVDTPDKGIMLTTSVQVAKQFITFNHAEGKQSAVVDLAGIVLDEHGAAVEKFGDRLSINIPAQPDAALRQDLIYNFQTALKPGLYQVRIAARDSKSRLTGSAMQWIEIPDLATRRLALSSLLLGEINRETQTLKGEAASIAGATLNVNRRFARTSRLRFLTYVYNAARGADNSASPDVALQVQILRDDQPVMTTTQRKVELSGQTDLARLAYAAELPLESMMPGHYVLQVTIVDRIAKTSAAQRTNFEIE
jgi:VWFA-related protein